MTVGDCAERGGAVSHQCSRRSVVLAPAKPPVSNPARLDRAGSIARGAPPTPSYQNVLSACAFPQPTTPPARARFLDDPGHCTGARNLGPPSAWDPLTTTHG